MSSLQRTIKRNHNKHDGYGCPRCGSMTFDHVCIMCGWAKKSVSKQKRDEILKAKLKQND